MSVRLGVVGCGSVFWTPYMSLIERLRGQGRVEVTAVYDADPDKRRRGRRAARPRRPTCPTTSRSAAHPDVDVVLVLTSMTEHGRLARAALEAGKHVLVEKPVATSLAEAEQVLAAGRGGARAARVRAAHPALADLPGDARARARGRDRRAADRARPLRLGRARTGAAGSTSRAAARCSTSASTTSRACAASSGPARRVTAMTGVAIPERVVDGEPMRVQAEDNAHVLIDFGDARFAVVTTGFTMQRYRSPCLELYGTHGVLQMLGDDWAPEGYELWRNDTTARVGAAPGVRPAVAVDRRAAPPRRVRRDRAASRSRGPSTPTTRWRSCSPRRRPAPTAARARSPATSRRPTSRGSATARRPRPRARPPERGVSLVERPAPPRPRRGPSFDGPALIRRADVTRHVWGDPAAGEVFDWIYASTERIHMLVFGLPPGGGFRHSRGLPHDLRRRRAAARAAGRARDRRPRDRRGPARRGRRERVLPPRHLAPRVRARPRAAARARAVRAAARRRRVERLRARAAVPARRRATPTTRCSATGRPPRRRDAAPARAAARRRALAARPRRAVRRAREHRAPHGRDARARPGRGGGRCTSTAATRC